MTMTLSIQDARRLALHGQGLLRKTPFGRGKAAALKAIQHLSYVQIDPISVVCRAHHHTLFNRAPGYRLTHLEALQKEGKVFEYWSHAAAYIPMADYRFCKAMMADYCTRQKHWYSRNKALMTEVLGRIQKEGPLMSRDFEDGSPKRGVWGTKPVKMALHELFIKGEIMIANRVGIQKVFDIPQRVLPDGTDTRLPDRSEFATFLIRRGIAAHGLVGEREIAYLRQGWAATIKKQLNVMLADGEVQTVEVNGQTYFTTQDQLEKCPLRLNRSRVFLLSPFDNAVIQRRRLQQLFEFEYQTEIYLPTHKRKYGYFSMPILWGDRFVGRIDPKADRKSAVLCIQNLMLESQFNNQIELLQALAMAIREFAKFNQCGEVRFAKPTPLNRTLGTLIDAD